MGTALHASHSPSYSHIKSQSIFITMHLQLPASQPAQRAIPAPLHYCVHTYLRGSDEELQHGRTVCPLHYAHHLQ